MIKNNKFHKLLNKEFSVKKNRLFFSLFALLIAISASFFINFSSNNNCVYANSTIGPQEITDFSQISNFTKWKTVF